MAFHFSARSGAIGALLLAAGCMAGESMGGSPELAGGGGSGGGGPGSASLVGVTNLSSDQSGSAASVDASLVNAWGIVAYQGWFWVTDEATGKLSIFDGAGHPAGAAQGGGGTGTGGTGGTGTGGTGGTGGGSDQSGQGSGSGQVGAGQGSGSGQGTLNVASDSINLGEGITGIAVNDSMAMQMDGTGANAQVCGPANLIVASVKGQLIGVNTSLNTTGGQVLVDRSSVGASYTGVAVLDVKADATCSATAGNCDTPGMGSGSGSGNSQGSGSDNRPGRRYGSGSAGAGSGSAGAGSGSAGAGSGSAGAGTGSGNGGTGNVPQAGVLVLAADFHNARIDVFDEKFNLVTTPMFSAPAGIPAGFAPFNVAVFNGIVYVTYAQQDPQKAESVAGAGLGFVAAFDVCGNMLWTAKGSQLNAPWGMALGGDLSLVPGALLVGNFGDGHITEINPKDGTIIDQLMTADGTPVVIDGLWGLAIGPGSGVASAQPGSVYFAAGPADEAHGVFGMIAPAAATMPGPGSGSGSNM
jgi:hypothetical protein